MIRPALAFTVLLSACASAPVAPSWTEGVTLTPIAAATGVDAAFILGKPAEPGLYTIRVHIHANGLMPPHTHPDTRQITVLSGGVLYGYGDKPDAAIAQHYKAGDVFVVPAGKSHYAITTTSDAVYQESGMAPTSTDWVK